MIKKAITNYDLRFTNLKSKIVNLKPQILVLFTVFVFTGCAGKWAYQRGDDFANAGEWDEAVIAFTEASQKEPDNVEYNIRLIMAKERASEYHYQKGSEAVQQDKLEEAVRELQMAVALNPANSSADSRLPPSGALGQLPQVYPAALPLILFDNDTPTPFP